MEGNFIHMSKRRKQKRYPHQATRQHAKSQTQSHTIHLEITPEQLIEKGNLPGAVDLLKTYIAKHSADDPKRRMLGNSLFNLGEYREAAETLLTLQEKNYADLVNIGAAYLNLEEWEQAISYLEASLQQKEWEHTYYLLALAHLQESANEDSRWQSPSVEAEQRAIDLLQKARSMPGCPVEVYLLLKNKLWSLACRKSALARRKSEGGPEACDREYDTARAACSQVIEEAFARYPDHPWVRLEFSEDLMYQKKYETALMILPPLINHDESVEPFVVGKAIAYAIDAAIHLELYEKALQHIELVPVPSPGGRLHQVSLLKLKGDLLLWQSKLDAARACYEQEIQNDTFIDTFIGTFSLAWIWLQKGELEQCRTRVRQAAELWFHHDNALDQHYALDGEPITIGTVHVGDNPARCVEQVCKKLLQEDVSLDAEMKGQLSYLLYRYTAAFYERGELPEEQKTMQHQLLRQAADWYPHPSISGDLVDLFLDVGDMPQAVEQHLLYCTYLFTLHPDDFDEDFVEFSRNTETITTDEERRAIHAVAFQLLQTCKDASTIQAVFLAFCDAFWRTLLQDGDMHQELADVTRILMDASDAVNHVWFYHAWALSELGRNEEAERIYRRYLEHDPDDTDTLHNLSLLVEEKGLFLEALEFSNKAAAIAPDDEVIVQQNSRLKRAYEEQERSRQEQERQERARLWSQLSDSQKWLLCLMELYPSAHWSALLPHIKKDERQLRQLQEDWERLLAHGACVQSEAEIPVKAVSSLLPFVWEEGFRYWLASEIPRVQARKKKNLWLPEAADLGDEQLVQLSPMQRDLMHQALMRQIASVSLSGLEHLYLLFYRRIWKRLLIQWETYAELVDLCHVFLTRLSVMTRQELWECAYYAPDLSSSSQYPTIAERLYRKYLEQGEGHAAYHNLSVIYVRRRQYQDALQMIEQALRLAPSDAGSLDLKANIEQAITKGEEQRRQREIEQQQQQEQRQQYLKSLEQKIAAHLGEVDYYKQKILQSLKDAPYYYSKRSLAKSLRMEDWAFEGHWKRLVSWGMIIEEGQRTAVIHPLVSSYLEQGWPVVPGSSMKTLVINPSANSWTKPVFNSKQEYKLYTVLLEMFHGQLVFPNMALQSIFPYAKMKEVLTKEEFNYYMISSVDICITRTTSYFPLVAFEVDGPYHEEEKQQRNDAFKNQIFEKGGLGLIRLQIGYQPLSTQEMWKDVREKINQALYTWRSDPTRKGWIEDVETELGMSRFGREALEHEHQQPQLEEKKPDDEDEQLNRTEKGE